MKTIERLRELEKAATPGPWLVKWEFNIFNADDRLAASCGGHSVNRGDGGVAENMTNAQFVAATRNALPALLAVVEAQAAEIEAWRANTAAIKVSADTWTVEYQAVDFNEIHPASAATDAALRALEGGAG